MRQYLSSTIMGFVATGVLVITACNKHDDYDNDPMQPDVQVTFPVNNQVYNSGDIVNIQGTVTDNSLHELRIKITNGTTELFSKIISVHDLTIYQFNESWKLSAAGVINAVVKVEVEDHGSNVVANTVNITINP